MTDEYRYWDVHEMCKEYARTAEMAKNEVQCRNRFSISRDDA
jgi:hypothetical protein